MDSGCSPAVSPLRPHDLTSLIDPKHPTLTIARQAELLGVSQRSYYYQPVVNEAEEARLKLHLNAVDEIYTKRPYYGTRRMEYELGKSYDIHIGRERIRHLMDKLGLQTIYPKRDTSKPNPAHPVYPYLLRGVTASYPNHIWGTDITYVRTHEGYVYLVAFLDWYSRYVVSWQLSDSLENSFVLAALHEALGFMADCGLGVPDICNSDQGSHFTAQAYIALLEQAGIQVSMDGRGRCLDNIFTERLWRTVKYENVFLQSYQDLQEAQAGLTTYFQFYNHERPHQSLDYRTPAAVYFGLVSEQQRHPLR
jgi:putative transposase